MIEVEHLSKSYRGIEAVSNLSFRVERGQVVGFLGPNGAGKSTTLRILAGFLGASSGRVRIAGFDIVDERLQALRQIGYMPETSPLYPEMKVREYLAFRAELKGVARTKRRVEIARCLELARVSEMAGVPIGHLSKGYRQRVGLADALLNSPPLLILDEPTAGLDPNQIREVRALIATLAEEHTVLVSTHILSEVEASCTRAVVIAKGRLVAVGSIDEIRGRGRPELTLVLRGTEALVRATLSGLDGIASATVEVHGDTLRAKAILTAEDDAALGEATERIVRALAQADVGVREVRTTTATLEEVFATLTRDDMNSATTDEAAP